MRMVFPRHYERLLVGIGLLAVLGSLGWFFLKQKEIQRIHVMPGPRLHANSVYEPAEPAAEFQAAHRSWLSPSPQSTGEAWLYELFTPPAVFYQPESSSFIVLSPRSADRSAIPFGLELLAVRRELFRVQMAGYFGDPGSYVAVFTQPGKSGVLHGASGTRFEDLGLGIKNIFTRRIAVKHRDDWPVYEVVVSVEIFDEHSGTVVVLDNGQPRFADTSVAEVRFSSTDGPRHDVHEGDVLSNDGNRYRIERITAEPAEITVSRESSGLRAETATLRPVAVASEVKTPASNPSHPDLPRPATGFAHYDKKP